MKNINKLLVQIAVVINSFPIFLPVFSVLATPSGVHVLSARPLDKTGLLLVDFIVLWPNGIPGEDVVTNKVVNYTYRVYCPTGMVRNVTNNTWGEAVSAWDNNSIGTGVFHLVLYQVCPEHHDRIIKNY